MSRPGFTPERMDTARTGNLGRLGGLLHEVRGIPLCAFYSFPNLKRLELLANACRHGDGDSAARLFKRHPELWPDWATMPMLLPGQLEPVAPVLPPSFDSIVVPRGGWTSSRTRLPGFGTTPNLSTSTASSPTTRYKNGWQRFGKIARHGHRCEPVAHRALGGKSQYAQFWTACVVRVRTILTRSTSTGHCWLPLTCSTLSLQGSKALPRS